MKSNQTKENKIQEKENKTKEKNMKKPIESHETAAWANIESTYPVSNVARPNESQVINAKEYVDSNKK